jgi:hypothetical protein
MATGTSLYVPRLKTDITDPNSTIMKKIFGLLFIMVTLTQVSMAQDSEGKGFDKSKLFFGGNLGLAFGTYTIINVSPLVGYQFTPVFAAGAGINYSYYGYNDGYYKYNQSYAGMSLFGRVSPIRQFFIQVQPEVNYIWGTITPYNNNQALTSKIPTQFVPSLLLGGGAAIPTGPNGAFTISVMYDVIQNPWSPYYHQAVYGFGYNVGF